MFYNVPLFPVKVCKFALLKWEIKHQSNMLYVFRIRNNSTTTLLNALLLIPLIAN